VIHANDPLGKNRPIRRHRFNIEAGARVLYFSEHPTTCFSEVQFLGFPPYSAAVIPVQVDLNAVIDLRDPAILATLQLTRAEVTFNFRSVPAGSPPVATQVLGECAAASGCVDGFLFESAAVPGATNLVVFEANLRQLNSRLIVNDPQNKLFDQLP
jgi:RES domain-containing protein